MGCISLPTCSNRSFQKNNSIDLLLFALDQLNDDEANDSVCLRLSRAADGRKKKNVCQQLWGGEMSWVPNFSFPLFADTRVPDSSIEGYFLLASHPCLSP